MLAQYTLPIQSCPLLCRCVHACWPCASTLDGLCCHGRLVCVSGSVFFAAENVSPCSFPSFEKSGRNGSCEYYSPSVAKYYNCHFTSDTFQNRQIENPLQYGQYNISSIIRVLFHSPLWFKLSRLSSVASMTTVTTPSSDVTGYHNLEYTAIALPRFHFKFHYIFYHTSSYHISEVNKITICFLQVQENLGGAV